MSRIAPRKLPFQKRPREEDPKHLAFIRQLPCVICMTTGLHGDTLSDAAHIRYADIRYLKETGRGEKPDDKWTVPLCRSHHDQQHSVNERMFWINHNIPDPCALALMLKSVSGNTNFGENVIKGFNLVSQQKDNSYGYD